MLHVRNRMGITLNPGLEKRIAEKVKSGEYASADELIAKSLDLLDGKDDAPQDGSRGSDSVPVREPIWETLVRLGREIPDEAWASVPSDLSKNLDHYLYGAPKETE